jgi:hypothetical protein
MPDPNQEQKLPGPETERSVAKQEAAEPMEDEEKILAGRIDVNIPALLTKDVQGG